MDLKLGDLVIGLVIVAVFIENELYFYNIKIITDIGPIDIKAGSMFALYMSDSDKIPLGIMVPVSTRND